MDEKKRFQKQALNSKDHDSMENAAKAVKGAVATALTLTTLFINKENIKSMLVNTVKIVTKVIK